MLNAYSIKVRGVVQGVGFRPFIYRLAQSYGLKGWVLNTEAGVDIRLEGEEAPLQLFCAAIRTQSPPAAVITDVSAEPVRPAGLQNFLISESTLEGRPATRMSPDLPVCDDCLHELFETTDRRYGYPYINCTNCGPRYSVICGLPYDRSNTTMAGWRLDGECGREYSDPADRRFHAQPVACGKCGPHYLFQSGKEIVREDHAAIRKAADFLRAGKIVAVKGIGGYHLACDAKNADAVCALRQRKFRKEKPFALMAKNLDVAGTAVALTPEAETLLKSAARPIVLLSALPAALCELSGVAPDSDEFGLLLPYTPLHHLLFAAGAPELLVMTSANRSSEPIAYEDTDALQQLDGIADAFLVGERPIARRVDDSVARIGAFGITIVRRARGYSPGAVASIPGNRPILALGADLKNSITLVVDGQAFVSQHIGDLQHYQSFCAFRETVQDLLSMYEIDADELLVVHDAHPQYLSTLHAADFPAAQTVAVQHHRAHIASVLAERNAWDQRVIGVSFDGTGFGDDGTIWGGEIFAGNLRKGFERAAHLRSVLLPGGDAAAACPVQAAAGFLSQLSDLPDLAAAPFLFPARYSRAVQLLNTRLRSFATTSAGRLFDAAAALLGFTREMSFEGQPAMWLEVLAKQAANSDFYPFPFTGVDLDFRPLLNSIIQDRIRGRDTREIARAFQRGLAEGLSQAVLSLCRAHSTDTVVLSGGVFQNELLLGDLRNLLEPELQMWTNHAVPANDGGISLGQAALGAFAQNVRSTPVSGHEIQPEVTLDAT